LGEVQEVNENYVLTQRGKSSTFQSLFSMDIMAAYYFLISQTKMQSRNLSLTHHQKQKEEKDQKVKIRDPESHVPVIEESLEVSKKESIRSKSNKETSKGNKDSSVNTRRVNY
jgi:hypothetical protein